MSNCTACGKEIADDGRFCSSCGTPVRVGDEVDTFDFGPPSPPRSSQQTSSPGPRPPSSSVYLSEGMFLPGSLVAGRYRIITLLGKGGMGEVYRADDMTLGQPVALKFLPSRAGRDESLLERFRNEVRIARRVSHPNVCRVYDVGDVDGQAFFTMEYVDGEDLASLLRRIGRLPQDKALDIARQLCAGLAAAHAKGVLHRDMKPANVMLDGRGQVVVTDFGLAGVAGQIQGAEVRSGTPAYMAPEQLAGEEVSVRSDIYSLGLVLYEIFTGKRAIAEKSTIAERVSGSSTPSRPSSVVKNLDPIIERVILRCLENEPSARPATVLSVAAALPGGDPLAAALAAGETPSPQLVAASGETVGLRPRTAVLCLASIVLGLGLAIYLSIRANALERMHVEQSPEVLTHKAREIIAQLGYTDRSTDSEYGLDADGDFEEFVEKHDKPHPNWDVVLAGRPSLGRYWYRQSPAFMFSTALRDQMVSTGIVTETDPATVVSGMVNLELDPQGRLIYLQAIPPQKETALAPSAPFDWNVLFVAAGLDLVHFQKTEPVWNALGAADTQAAWNGTWDGATSSVSRPLHVEAATWHGKPTFFALTGEWTKPDRVPSRDESPGKKVSQGIELLLVFSLLFGAVYLARLNYRQGRGDREGAFRLASVMFGLDLLLWLCRVHMVPSIEMLGMLILAVSGSLFISAITWLLYMALEPWVRKRWPQAIISWSRLLSGQFRDAVVGRDVLFGVMLGMIWMLVFQLRYIPMMRMGAAPGTSNIDYLMGGRHAFGLWLFQIPNSILGTLQFFFLLVGLRVLLRKDWLAAIAFVAIFALPRALNSHYAAIEVPTQILVYAIAALIVFRFGLVPLAVAIFTVDMLANVPFASDFSAWYMSTSILALLSVVVLAGWGFYQSLGGVPLWSTEVD